MKAYIVREFGGTDVMKWAETRDPVPAPGQVLVRIRASGVNFAETRMRAGTYTGQRLPFVMGMEGAGIVASVGPDVTAFRPGDRVFGRARGCHAEKVLFHCDDLMHLPASMSFADGAAVPVGWLTAWHALMTVGTIQPGQRILIEAIASSVGSAALQLAKWRNCWVAGTASRDQKLTRAPEFGADAVYNYLTEDFVTRVMQDTDGRGVDVSLMVIGQSTAGQLLDCTGMEGKVIMVGSTGGRKVCFDLAIGARNLQLLSMDITTSSLFQPVTMKAFREEALPAFADGTLRPVVDEVLEFGDLARAHQLIADRNHFGKIILQFPGAAG